MVLVTSKLTQVRWFSAARTIARPAVTSSAHITITIVRVLRLVIQEKGDVQDALMEGVYVPAANALYKKVQPLSAKAFAESGFARSVDLSER